MRAAAARRLSMLVAAALLALAGVACGSTPASPPSVTAPTSGERDPLPAVRDITESGASTIAASPSPDWAVAAAGSVWSPESVVGCSATTRARCSERRGGGLLGVLGHGPGLWVDLGDVVRDYSSPKLVRIDATTGASTAEIPIPARLPAESSVGVGEGAVWLPRGARGNYSPSTRPRTRWLERSRRPRARRPSEPALDRCGYRSPPRACGPARPRIRPNHGHGGSWPSASFLALGPDAVWVVDASDGAVSRVDPQRTRSRRQSWSRPARYPAVTSRHPRTRSGCGSLATPSPCGSIRTANAVIHRLGPSAGSGGIAIADTSVWITAHDTQSIWQLPR